MSEKDRGSNHEIPTPWDLTGRLWQLVVSGRIPVVQGGTVLFNGSKARKLLSETIPSDHFDTITVEGYLREHPTEESAEWLHRPAGLDSKRVLSLLLGTAPIGDASQYYFYLGTPDPITKITNGEEVLVRPGDEDSITTIKEAVVELEELFPAPPTDTTANGGPELRVV